jgi:hypothetical protein
MIMEKCIDPTENNDFIVTTEKQTIKSFPLMINTSLIEKIQELTQYYYSTNKKSSYQKKTQKLDCSKFIWENVKPNIYLIDATIFIDENRIYINYPLFKLYANQEIYDRIIDYIMESIFQIITKYINFEVHINIDGFTISAGERYKEFINMIFFKVFSSNYAVRLYKMYIYNPPSVIEYLKPIFRNITNNKNIMGKVVILN